MAAVGPICSMPPASRAMTLEKMVWRMRVRARAAVRYSRRPLRSCAAKVAAAANRAARNASPAPESASAGANRLPKKPATISDSAVLPTSARKLTAAMARMSPHSPRASFNSVLFNRSMEMEILS